jgi:hypothetical protein
MFFRDIIGVVFKNRKKPNTLSNKAQSFMLVLLVVRFLTPVFYNIRRSILRNWCLGYSLDFQTYSLIFYCSVRTGYSPTEGLISTANSPCFSVRTGCSPADNFHFISYPKVFLCTDRPLPCTQLHFLYQSVVLFNFKVDHSMSDGVT